MAATSKAPQLTLHAAADALDVVREWLLDPEHVEALVAADGDLDALPALRDLLETAELDFKLKAERVALVAQEKGRRAKFIREEIARLDALARADESAEKGLKSYLLLNLSRANVKKVDGTLARPRVQVNGSPSVVNTLTPEAIKELHLKGSVFTVLTIPEPVYSLPTSGVVQAWKDACEAVGPAPEIGEPDYAPRYAYWLVAVDEELRKLGLPAGVRVERGSHVRIQ